MTTQQPPKFLALVQTGILRSVDPQLAVYFFFRITDAEKFRRALPGTPGGESAFVDKPVAFYSEASRIAQQQLDAPPDFTHFANIAFTYTGLGALGVDAATLQTFPEPFAVGMAARAVLLGDDGPAAPENWDGWLGSRDIHGLLSTSFHWNRLQPVATTLAQLQGLVLALKQAAPNCWLPDFPVAEPAGDGAEVRLPPMLERDSGIEILQAEFGISNYVRGDNGEIYRVEHFGNRDGVSQPYAKIGLGAPPPGGGTPRPGDGWAPVAVGEVLVGQADEDGREQHLPANSDRAGNGSYMAVRKLEQDVVGWRSFLARNESGHGRDWLGAQFVGRWPDGAPLVRYPNGPQAQIRFGSDPLSPPAPTINDFRYQRDDPLGRRCPIGAHIRRSNPRDTNNRDDARRHRLFRRSVSYGGPLLPEGSKGDGHRRGLLFITMQARLERQFEFVQAAWLNRGELEGQAGARRDPVMGAHAGQVGDAFQPAGRPAPVTHLPRFVTTRGGEYLFVPSFTALAKLKAGDTFPPNDPAAPMPQPALGNTVPVTGRDEADELVKIGKSLLTQPSAFQQLPPVPVQPWPNGPTTDVTTIVVGRYDHVTATLNDDAHFSVKPIARRIARILGEQKLLIGMDRSDPERTERLDFLSDALKLLGPAPIAALAELTEMLTRVVLDRVLPQGKLDVVQDFGRVIPILVAAELFGMVGPGSASATGIAALFGRLDLSDVPDDWLRSQASPEDYLKPLLAMQTWTRASFLQIFVNVPGTNELAEAAERAVGEFVRQIDALVLHARRVGRAPPRNLLDALIRVQRPNADRHIRLILAEFAAGAVETVNAALANTVDFLLDNKDRVRQVICDHLVRNVAEKDRATARDKLCTLDLGELVGRLNDDELEALIREILRFAPMGPISFREANEGAAIDHQTVQPGWIVALVIAAAMLDPATFPDPDQIKLDRDPNLYLHFGTGLHRCAGQFIAAPMLRVLFRAIASQRMLRRAAGAAGQKAGIYPLLADRLVVRFEPSADQAWKRASSTPSAA